MGGIEDWRVAFSAAESILDVSQWESIIVAAAWIWSGMREICFATRRLCLASHNSYLLSYHKNRLSMAISFAVVEGQKMHLDHPPPFLTLF